MRSGGFPEVQEVQLLVKRQCDISRSWTEFSLKLSRPDSGHATPSREDSGYVEPFLGFPSSARILNAVTSRILPTRDAEELKAGILIIGLECYAGSIVVGGHSHVNTSKKQGLAWLSLFWKRCGALAP